MASCWESFTSALSPASTGSSSQREAALREQLLAREERLRERADALRRKHDEVVRDTAAAEAATLDAETLEREAEARRRVLMVTKEKNDEELPVLIMELKAKDERVRVLEAIFDTAPPDQRLPHRALPDTAEAEKGAAATAARGSAWSRGRDYPNPPEHGWLERPQYPHPPDPTNPDPATLRKWLYVSRRYSRWYSRAWGAAVLAGAAVFAVGWAMKGSNPFPSHQASHGNEPPHDAPAKEP